MVCSRPRACLAVVRETPAVAGMPFSQIVISSPVSELSCRAPPVRADELAEQPAAVLLRAQADILHGQPPVDPLAERDLAR